MKDYDKEYRRLLKQWYKEIKASKRCVLCGSNKKKQFHHVNPDNKIESISQMVHKCYPKDVIMAEMEKCIVLCNSCHCKEHNKMRKKV